MAWPYPFRCFQSGAQEGPHTEEAAEKVGTYPLAKKKDAGPNLTD